MSQGLNADIARGLAFAMSTPMPLRLFLAVLLRADREGVARFQPGELSQLLRTCEYGRTQPTPYPEEELKSRIYDGTRYGAYLPGSTPECVRASFIGPGA